MTPDEKDEVAEAPGPGALLDQVRDNAMQILAEVPCTPSTLHVSSGDASVDISWPVRAEVAGVALAEVAPAAQVVCSGTPEPAGGYLIAQTVGVFYPCPEPGAAPFVTEGDMVVAGQQVGIIEAMKLMIPVTADRVGWIAEVLKENAEPVEYGDRLFGLHAEETR
jgi:acetyl-CoA carboxylase biotin carboxyl carrier protein